MQKKNDLMESEIFPLKTMIVLTCHPPEILMLIRQNWRTSTRFFSSQSFIIQLSCVKAIWSWGGGAKSTCDHLGYQQKFSFIPVTKHWNYFFFNFKVQCLKFWHFHFECWSSWQPSPLENWHNMILPTFLLVLCLLNVNVIIINKSLFLL